MDKLKFGLDKKANQNRKEELKYESIDDVKFS